MLEYFQTQLEEVIEEAAPVERLTHEEHLECFFYSEAEAADRLGIHRTTLRSLALAGKAPVEPIPLTDHRRVYRRIDIHRLAGIEP
ncbi:helix-turn-helix transcriptional regulator [Microbacterium trichothecenolyticum]